MFTLYSKKPQLIFHPFYSKHEAIDTPCNQRSEKTLDWFLIHRTEVVSIKMRPKNQTRRRITTEANRNISQQQKNDWETTTNCYWFLGQQNKYVSITMGSNN